MKLRNGGASAPADDQLWVSGVGGSGGLTRQSGLRGQTALVTHKPVAEALHHAL